jgi:tRNA(fMet)-specific endonuclease VapC
VKYLLDTDHISFLQKRRGPEYAALIARTALHSPADFAFAIVSFHEQVLGGHALLNRASTAAHLIRGYAFLLEILQSYITTPVLPFDAAAAGVFDGLQAQKIRVATMDLRIAAIALSQGLTLLTRNTRDFGRVPGLITEDWTV